MWSSNNIDARSMINDKINEFLSSIEQFNETILYEEKLLLTKRILLIYNLFYSLTENSNIGIKRDISNEDNYISLKKRNINVNWFTL
jgi:hypothetical protein